MQRAGVPEAAASQVPPASSHNAGTMHQHAKKNSIESPKPTAPPSPSGLARRPRRIHTKSTAPTTPAATDGLRVNLLAASPRREL